LTHWIFIKQNFVLYFERPRPYRLSVDGPSKGEPGEGTKRKTCDSFL